MKRFFISAIMVFSITLNCIGQEITIDVSDTPKNNSSKDSILTSENVVSERETMSMITLTIGDKILTATLVDNSTTEALLKKLSEGPITISMKDYGSMEKVGPLGFNLPRNDEQITTAAGDLILYQGSAFVIYYEPNSWNFTRIGKINNVTKDELIKILGKGNVTVLISLKK